MTTQLRTTILTLSVGAVLGACAANRSGEPVETGPRERIDLRDDDDRCGASLVQGYLNLRANDLLRAEVAQRSGAGNIRWIEPGTAVTMDFRADRLNGELDEDGVIQTLRCG